MHLLLFSCQSPVLQLLRKEVGKMCEILLRAGRMRQGFSSVTYGVLACKKSLTNCSKSEILMSYFEILKQIGLTVNYALIGTGIPCSGTSCAEQKIQ